MSSIAKFLLEIDAHSVHTTAATPLRGALGEVFRRGNAKQWGSDVIYIIVTGGTTVAVVNDGD